MANVAIVHMDLMAKGGGESVCMNVLEAIQDDHDVTLITLTDPDLEELNDYFNTDVRLPTVERAGLLAPRLHRRCGLKYYVLQNALLSRYAGKHADEYDLLVSTINELGLPGGSIEYIHFPFDWNMRLDGELRERIFHPTVEEDGFYEGLCTSVAGLTEETFEESRLLANSAWTADAVESAYDIRPDVVYPPVDTSEFVDRPWGEREPGFVTVGRIERSKRIHELIGIVDAVRERGYDTHLHVIGPTVDTDYYDEITRMADRRPYVYIEGELPRAELVDRICTHRYGIHGKRHEHFGMAVAELAAGGAIPFVPATGGPSVIVDDRPELQYGSPEDAAEKITRVLSQPTLRATLRPDPETIRRRFGRERFQKRIATAVDAALDGTTEPFTESTASVPASTD